MTPDRQITVMVAEDHTIMRQGLTALLNSLESYKVLFEGEDGTALIRWLEKSKQQPDICIMDIGMKPMDGFDTALFLKENFPDIKILVLSMLECEFSIIRMLQNGASGYLHKGTDTEELDQALQIIYTGQFYHSELVSENALQRARKPNGAGITEREAEFLTLCCTGLVYKEIASKMKVSPHTVNGYRNALFEKLGIRSRSALIMHALRSGIVAF